MGKIQIKRRGQNSDKSIENISLEAGELLVDLKDNNNKLYVGDAEGKPQLVSGDETRLSTLEDAVDNRATNQALNTEISARQQADSSLQTQIRGLATKQDLNTEISDLQAQINGITAGGASHGHNNKALLDKIKLGDDISKNANIHAHSNISVLNTITQDDIATWNSKANSADVVSQSAFTQFKTENTNAINNAVAAHTEKQDNPHKVTAGQIGLGKVANKTVAEIKTELTGTVADGNDKFVTGDAAYDAIEAAKTTVINSLDSDKEDAALSAKQGYILNSKIQYGNKLPEQNTALSKDLPEGTIYLYIPN